MRRQTCFIIGILLLATSFGATEAQTEEPAIYFYDYTWTRKLRLYVAPLSDPTLWLTSAKAYKFLVSDENVNAICEKVGNDEGKIGLSIKDDIVLLIPEAQCQEVSPGDYSPDLHLPPVNLPATDLSKLELPTSDFEQNDRVFISPDKRIGQTQGTPVITWNSGGEYGNFLPPIPRPW